jgi:hypothetical protein
MQDQKASGDRSNYKLYVEVGVVYSPAGVMEPKYLRIAPDGGKYMIDKIYRHQRLASRKAGGCGICYFVRVRGQDARLFYEDSPDACRWFVESKYPV